MSAKPKLEQGRRLKVQEISGNSRKSPRVASHVLPRFGKQSSERLKTLILLVFVMVDPLPVYQRHHRRISARRLKLIQPKGGGGLWRQCAPEF
jgi:hypothetical protein